MHRPSPPVRPPVIVHHMAAMDDEEGRRYPPNSREAIRHALASGAAFVEVDVTALADGDYLLVHDPRLEAETDGVGPVAECSTSRARELHFVREGRRTPFRVPRLSEVISDVVAAGGTSRLQLDFKNVAPFPTPEPLERLVRLIEPLGERVIVSSEADWQLRQLRRLAPRLDRGLDVHFYLDSRQSGRYPQQRGAYGYWDDHPLAIWAAWPTAEYLADRCASLLGLVPGISTVYISHWLLAQSLADGFNWATALHKHGIRLDAWTLDANHPAAVAHLGPLYAAGVDQFTTNTPRALAALLAAL